MEDSDILVKNMCTKEEVRAVVTEEMVSLKEEIFTHINKRFADFPAHMVSAQTTVDELCKLRNWQHEHDEAQKARDILRLKREETDALWRQEMIEFSKDMKRAMFGDKQTGEIGMVREHKIVFDKMIGFKGVEGFFKWFLLSGGVVGLLFALFQKF